MDNIKSIKDAKAEKAVEALQQISRAIVRYEGGKVNRKSIFDTNSTEAQTFVDNYDWLDIVFDLEEVRRAIINLAKDIHIDPEKVTSNSPALAEFGRIFFQQRNEITEAYVQAFVDDYSIPAYDRRYDSTADNDI